MYNSAVIIVGLTGGIGHGKTTFAALLDAQSRTAGHFETWELVAEVASGLRAESPVHPAPDDLAGINRWLRPLGDIVAQYMHASVSYDAIHITAQKVADHPKHYVKLFEYLQLIQDQPELAAVEITPELKQIFRPLLQWLGGFMVLHVGNGVWYDEILRRIALLQASGCDIVTIGGVRFPGDAERLRNAGGLILDINRPNLPCQDSQDITERERALIHPDGTVINDGSLDELQQCATLVYKDLCHRTLQTSYNADPLTSKKQPLEPAQN